jgi:hypothetical protein
MDDDIRKGTTSYTIVAPQTDAIPMFTTLYVGGNPMHLVQKEDGTVIGVWGEAPKTDD